MKRQAKQIERLKRRITSRSHISPELEREVPGDTTSIPATKGGALHRFNRVARPWRER